MNLRTLLIAGSALLAGFTSCASSSDVLADSQRFADQHNFYQAYWVVANALDSYPDDPEVERVFWLRRRDYLLDRGQWLVFHEREQEAIEEFQKALALDPENEKAKAWIGRAKEKLASEAVRRADTLRYEGDLPGALKLYNKAMAYVPELEQAVKGIESVNGKYQARTEKATEHYVLGSRARGEQQFQQSYYHSSLSEELDRSLEKAKVLRKASGKRLASEILARCEKMEAAGFYSAALQEYKRVKAELPDAEGLDERIAAMEREVKVRAMCREAEMLTRKKEFERADELLTAAFKLTENEKARVSGLIYDTKTRRYETAYRKAKDLELDLQYEAALEAYTAIDKNWRQGFLDVKARISGLTAHIEEATKSWQQGVAAEKSGDLKKAIDRYQEAVLVYPGFKKLEAHIKDLQARVGTTPRT